jgi:hypothetical protein
LAAQTCPHVPQFRLSLFVSAQYGEPPSGEHSVWKLAHSDEQPPSKHATNVPLHVFPHAPQFALSLVRFAQYVWPPPSAPHSVWSDMHAPVHAPPKHVSSTPHVFPHAPQFC